MNLISQIAAQLLEGRDATQLRFHLLLPAEPELPLGNCDLWSPGPQDRRAAPKGATERDAWHLAARNDSNETGDAASAGGPERSEDRTALPHVWRYRRLPQFKVNAACRAAYAARVLQAR